MSFPPYSEMSKAILSILKQRNGRATTAEVSRELIKRFRMTDEEEVAKSTNGESAWKSRLRNTKQALIKHELLDADEPGVWALRGK